MNSKPRDWKPLPVQIQTPSSKSEAAVPQASAFSGWANRGSSLEGHEIPESVSSLGGITGCFDPLPVSEGQDIIVDGFGQVNSESRIGADSSEQPSFPVYASVQESCLLRYFIEELSPLVRLIRAIVN